MSEKKVWFLSLIISVLLWGAISWPLPMHMHAAIPYSSQIYDEQEIVDMVSGDHLQFLYFFALVKDMLSGETPLFYNLYEFNTGNDAERFEPDPYFVPFSLLFSLIAWVSNYALAWNLTGLIILWLSYVITWKLVRRYGACNAVAATAALITFALPFRWATLLGGSPTGLAMLWPPLVLYGVDLAVRENKLRGGFIAGASLLFALWTDLHVYYFTSLLVPFWCVIAFIQRDEFLWTQGTSYRRLAVALLPVPLFVIGGAVLRKIHTQGVLANEEPRSWAEAALFSPRPNGLFHRVMEISGHIYLGYGLVLLVAAGLAAVVFLLVRANGRHQHARNIAVYVLIVLAVFLSVILALGTFGPREGKLYQLARDYIPYYAMMRQSAKIYCLLPPMLAVLTALSFHMMRSVFERKVAFGIWIAGWSWVLVSAFHHVGAGLTWLHTEQKAYAAVAEDARRNNLRPGILVSVLWPGDAHFTSVYQIHALTYHLHMANGYSPMVTKAYRDEMYHPFESINQGYLSEEQVDSLIARGIHYVLVHQNMFPEKVSPFPVGFTLKNLLNNSRIQLMEQDERVWAFKLLKTDDIRETKKQDWTTFFCGRRFEAERLIDRTKAYIPDPQAGGGAFVRLPDAGSIRTRPFGVTGMPELAWLVRVRGNGTLNAATEHQPDAITAYAVMSDTWTWLRIPAGFESGYTVTGLEMDSAGGVVDVDMILLSGGNWTEWEVGESRTLTAARFFHGGFMNIVTEEVSFRMGHDMGGMVLYGPKLPMALGRYEVTASFTTSAESGTRIGLINLNHQDDTGAGESFDLVAGEPAVGIVDLNSNLPFNLAFHFFSNADVDLQNIKITRLTDGTTEVQNDHDPW